MMNDEARRRYEASGNMLFVLEAFFRRVDILCGKLSEPQVRDAKPKKREYRLDDGGGLCLLITPDGSKQWHIGDHCFADYTFPERSLSYARRYYLAWRDLVSKGKYPATEEYEREIEARIDCLYDNEPDVPIPAWMAQALTDAFKQHYSRNFLHHKNTTLDDILGISGKKYREEFDIFTIDDRTLVDKAREVQWTCNLAFATACKHAKRILELDSSARGDNIDRKATYPLLRTVRERESRGDYGDLSAWCNGKSYAPLVNHYIRESFLELMDMIDPQLRLEIENDMKDVRKRWLKF